MVPCNRIAPAAIGDGAPGIAPAFVSAVKALRDSKLVPKTAKKRHFYPSV